jgi:hypothetical protein
MNGEDHHPGHEQEIKQAGRRPLDLVRKQFFEMFHVKMSGEDAKPQEIQNQKNKERQEIGRQHVSDSHACPS